MNEKEDSQNASQNGSEDTIYVNLSNMDDSASSPLTMLHTAKATVNGLDVKILIDQGSNSSVATKRCIDKLRLSSTKASQLLNIKTLTGTKQVTSSKVQIPFHDGVYLDAYILDSNLVLQSEKEINVGLLWPTLDKQLAKEIKNNIVKGRIDIIVGLDQLYGKISNTNTLNTRIND